MAFNVANIASSSSNVTKSSTISLRVAGPHVTISSTIVDVSLSTMGFNVAKIASERASLTISLRVAGL